MDMLMNALTACDAIERAYIALPELKWVKAIATILLLQQSFISNLRIVAKRTALVQCKQHNHDGHKRSVVDQRRGIFTTIQDIYQDLYSDAYFSSLKPSSRMASG
jgi:hypothetical protein